MQLESERTTIPEIIPFANYLFRDKDQPPTNIEEFTREVEAYNAEHKRDLMSASFRGVTLVLEELVDNILKKRGTYQEPPKNITIEDLLVKINENPRNKIGNRGKDYTIEQLIDALVKWKENNRKDFLTLLPGLIDIRLHEIITLLIGKRNATGFGTKHWKQPWEAGSRRKSRKRRKSVRR